MLGEFNARAGRSTEVENVIGVFEEETCNASGNKLISFLNEVELVVCNGTGLGEAHFPKSGHRLFPLTATT